MKKIYSAPSIKTVKINTIQIVCESITQQTTTINGNEDGFEKATKDRDNNFEGGIGSLW